MERIEGLTTLRQLPFHLVEPFPEVAVAVVRAGGVVKLVNPKGDGWDPDIRALHALRRVDPEVAEQVLTGSEAKFVDALQAPQQHDIRGLAEFIAIADELSEQHLDRVLANIDPVACEPVWRDRLADAPEDAAALLGRAVKIEGPVGDAARRQLATFKPSSPT